MKKQALSKEVVTRVRKALKEMVGNEREGLFPLHLDTVRKASGLEFNEGDETTYTTLLESICGATDDSQPAEQYDGTLGVTTAFVAANQPSVGQLQWNNNLSSLYTTPGTVSGARWCTGTLISNDLFLTAGHCFDQSGGGWVRPVDNNTGATITNAEIANNMHVNFNYQVDPSGTLRAEQSFPITSLVEYRLGGLDFAIVRLSGNPGATWGTTPVSSNDASIGDMLCIIGHPAGWPKRIEAGPCLNVSGAKITYNDIDTLGGNSGSGVLRASDGRIVGVHTNGGCGASSPGVGSNSGVRITSIIAQSPTLQTLTAAPGTLRGLDNPMTVKSSDLTVVAKHKALDDHITLKNYDDHIGTLKALDDTITHKHFDYGWTGTHKAIDDVKSPALDKGFSDHKLPGSDRPPWGRRPGYYGRPGEAPFVMSTPHHSNTLAGKGSENATAGSDSSSVITQYEETLNQIETTIHQHIETLNQLDADYRQVLNEYHELVQRNRI